MHAVLRSPREILFGAGQRHALPWVAARHGRRALVFADPHIAAGPDLAPLLEGLEGAGVAVVLRTDVVPELPTDHVQTAVTAAKELDADVVIAIGGGSCIDLAKIVAVMLTHGGAVEDYYGEFSVPGPTVPVIAVPTTAGTGSEATPVAVLTDVVRQVKVGVSSPHLIPAVAICDPELTYSCPPAVTASSGADALSHCIEALTAVSRQPSADLARDRVFVGRSELTDLLAITGIRHIAASLHRAYRDPLDVEARESMMYGALLAGLAFGTAGTAAAHALQYPVGALTHTPHGVGVGALLPYAMEHNASERRAELALIAAEFGADGADAAEQAPALVAAFLAAVGIPTTLAQIGFPFDRIGWAAEQGTRAVRLSENNAVPLTVQAATAILEAAYAGDLGRVATHLTGGPA